VGCHLNSSVPRIKRIFYEAVRKLASEKVIKELLMKRNAELT
jgi:hypothetical protein